MQPVAVSAVAVASPGQPFVALADLQLFLPRVQPNAVLQGADFDVGSAIPEP
jgi:hypothetical protein